MNNDSIRTGANIRPVVMGIHAARNRVVPRADVQRSAAMFVKNVNPWASQGADIFNSKVPFCKGFE